jgi:hypothetical protein
MKIFVAGATGAPLIFARRVDGIDSITKGHWTHRVSAFHFRSSAKEFGR